MALSIKPIGGTLLIYACLSGAAAQDVVTGVWEGELRDPVRPNVMAVDFDRRTVSFNGADPTPMRNLRTEADLVEFEMPAATGRSVIPPDAAETT